MIISYFSSDFFFSHGLRTDVSNGARKYGKDLDKLPKRFLLHHPIYPSCISHHMSTVLAQFLCLFSAKGVSKDNQAVNPVIMQTSQFIRITPNNLVFCLGTWIFRDKSDFFFQFKKRRMLFGDPKSEFSKHFKFAHTFPYLNKNERF